MDQPTNSREPEKSRAEYSTLNAGAAMAAQVLAIIIGYYSRVVFTRTLSASYVGVNGLFTDVLGILALSELGIGSAMGFALYRPAAQGDIPKLQTLMNLFRRLYWGVAAAVGGIGLLLLPFLNLIADDETASVEHLPLIYLMYLGNSVLSYLLIYRQSILTAHQREYIISIYITIFNILRTALQIFILRTTRNFILYSAVSMLCTILCNICISRRALRMYPYLRETHAEKLPREEWLTILRNIRALLLHRLGAVLINHTDSLLLSLFSGLVSVGIYSNYNLVISSVRQVLDRLFRGISASVGNLGATEDREAMEPVFQTAFFIGQWVYGICAIFLYELLQPFIELSFGPYFLFDRRIVAVLCILFFYHGLRTSIGTFWYALGMFRLDQYKALAEALLNLIFSIILGRRYGAFGVFMGTILSALATSAWIDPYLFFRHCLGKPVSPFLRRYISYLAVLAGTWGAVHLLCGLVSGPLVRVLFIRLLICGVVGDGILLAVYFRRREFQSALWLVTSLVKKYAGRIREKRRGS